jgi:hypothetical protein
MEKLAKENKFEAGETEYARLYKVVQIWPGLFVCKQVTVCPGHIWTTLYIGSIGYNVGRKHSKTK